MTNFASRQVRAAVPGPLAGASKQVRSYAAEAKASPTEVSSILEQRIRGVQEEAGLAETGRVLSVGYVLGLMLVEKFALRRIDTEIIDCDGYSGVFSVKKID